jgi:LysM repeat protein
MMNATNPFQITSWAEINREQRRRDRFKKTVIVAVAVAVLLLAGLLIEGCKIERATTATPVTPPSPVAAVPAAPPAASVSKGNMMTDAGQTTTVYVVKSGDTLSRIAKAHGTTVKAIEAANSLNGDQIVVGAKLKIPEA